MTVIPSKHFGEIASVRVLIVEDQSLMITLLRDMLHIIGFKHVYVAKNGKEAIETLQNTPMDLVISDWTMAGMDGLEFVKYVRNSPDSPQRFVPIIMLTGKSDEQDVIRARDVGVNEYIVKPFTATGLGNRIKAVIDNPRRFILSPVFKGPDRRRRKQKPRDSVDRRKRPEE